MLEGFTQRKLPDRSAWPTSTIAHWAYGSAAGAAYGILAGSLPSPYLRYGVPAYWDKRHALWRVSQDDPDSDLYATSPDADAVIEYMATHS